jgi:hypothetical protein
MLIVKIYRAIHEETNWKNEKEFSIFFTHSLSVRLTITHHTNFGMVGDLAEVINYAKFGIGIFNGFRLKVVLYAA